MCKICYIKTPPGIPVLTAASAVGYKAKFWPVGKVLTISVLGGSPDEIAFIMKGAAEWEKYANIKFKYIDEWKEAIIRVQLDPAAGSYSYIGNDAEKINNDQPTMNFGWLHDDIRLNDLATVLHELGHALGLGHEHQNPNQPIPFDREETIGMFSGAPNYWTVTMIEHNILNVIPIDEVDATATDYESVMMYYFPGSITTNGIGTKQNKVLSALDKKFIGLIYPFEDKKRDEAFINLRAYLRDIWHNRSLNRLTKQQILTTLGYLKADANPTARKRKLIDKLKKEYEV